jgi:molybdopterin-guanine dinucleotide biosynthesis protein A
VRTGVILAGGRSSRFGSDKLAVELAGTSLVTRAVEAVASMSDRIVVAAGASPAELPTADVRLAIVHDPDPFEGPLAALANVLATAVDPDPVRDLAIVVGGDMPGLVPDVLRSMLDRLANDPAVDAVLLQRPNAAGAGAREGVSRRAVLPLGLRVAAARTAAIAAIAAGDRSLQALVDRLSHAQLPASEWLAMDPDASTLLDVDTLADLERLRGM